MYNMTINGFTRNDIINNLTKRGIRKRDGKVFTGTYIDHILRTEKYTGEYWYYFNKKKIDFDPNNDEYRMRITKGYEPIISKEDYEIVQKILENAQT